MQGALEMLILNVSLPIRGKAWGYLDRALTRVLSSNKLWALDQVLCLSEPQFSHLENEGLRVDAALVLHSAKAPKPRTQSVCPARLLQCTQAMYTRTQPPWSDCTYQPHHHPLTPRSPFLP